MLNGKGQHSGGMTQRTVCRKSLGEVFKFVGVKFQPDRFKCPEWRDSRVQVSSVRSGWPLHAGGLSILRLPQHGVGEPGRAFMRCSDAMHKLDQLLGQLLGPDEEMAPWLIAWLKTLGVGEERTEAGQAPQGLRCCRRGCHGELRAACGVLHKAGAYEDCLCKNRPES